MVDKYFSAFAGIGGFEIGISEVNPGAVCIGYSEIDKYAIKVYKSHYIHKNYGNVNRIAVKDLPDFDLLVGGSPCPDLSIANNKRTGLSGKRSKLFYKFLDILSVKRPKYFILENVASMSEQNKEMMIKLLKMIYPETQVTMVDAALLTAQSRKRLFFTNFPVEKPDDKHIFVKDILEHKADKKIFVKHFKILKENKRYIMTNKLYSNGNCSMANRAYKLNAKMCALNYNTQSRVALGKEIRALTSAECARLQGFPDDWCDTVSWSRSVKLFGNAVNVEVVKHILRQIPDIRENHEHHLIKEQKELFQWL